MLYEVGHLKHISFLASEHELVKKDLLSATTHNEGKQMTWPYL
jgi:hypothetical protein